MTRSIIGLVVLAGLGLAAFSVFRPTELRAEVECKANGDNMVCSIRHVKGDEAAKVCFDLAINCRSGRQATAHGCDKVVPSQTISKVIEGSDFTGLEGCEGVGLAVSNITVAQAN